MQSYKEYFEKQLKEADKVRKEIILKELKELNAERKRMLSYQKQNKTS